MALRRFFGGSSAPAPEVVERPPAPSSDTDDGPPDRRRARVDARGASPLPRRLRLHPRPRGQRGHGRDRRGDGPDGADRHRARRDPRGAGRARRRDRQAAEPPVRWDRGLRRHPAVGRGAARTTGWPSCAAASWSTPSTTRSPPRRARSSTRSPTSCCSSRRRSPSVRAEFTDRYAVVKAMRARPPGTDPGLTARRERSGQPELDRPWAEPPPDLRQQLGVVGHAQSELHRQLPAATARNVEHDPRPTRVAPG